MLEIFQSMVIKMKILTRGSIKGINRMYAGKQVRTDYSRLYNNSSPPYPQDYIPDPQQMPETLDSTYPNPYPHTHTFFPIRACTLLLSFGISELSTTLLLYVEAIIN